MNRIKVANGVKKYVKKDSKRNKPLYIYLLERMKIFTRI